MDAARLSAMGLILLAAACHAPAQPAPGWYEEQSIEVDGQQRRFRYLVPPGLTASPPLVVYLHGGGGNMRAVTDGNPAAAWPDVAADGGFVLLLPNGTNAETGDPAGNAQHWNDCRSDAGVAETGADDVAYLEALIDWAVAGLAVDPDRVYLSGSSNGGMMSFRMADEAPERIAAIAAFVANRPARSECVLGRRPLPMMLVMGTEDPLMPYGGGQVASDRGQVISAEETRDHWLARNAISAAPKVTPLPDVDLLDGSSLVQEDYAEASGELTVRFLQMNGGGHSMPSLVHRLSPLRERVVGPQNHDAEGPELAWAFLAPFTRNLEVLFASDFE